MKTRTNNSTSTNENTTTSSHSSSPNTVVLSNDQIEVGAIFSGHVLFTPPQSQQSDSNAEEAKSNTTEGNTPLWFK